MAKAPEKKDKKKPAAAKSQAKAPTPAPAPKGAVKPKKAPAHTEKAKPAPHVQPAPAAKATTPAAKAAVIPAKPAPVPAPKAVVIPPPQVKPAVPAAASRPTVSAAPSITPSAPKAPQAESRLQTVQAQVSRPTPQTAPQPAARPQVAVAEKAQPKPIIIHSPITVKDLAVKFNARPTDVISRLIKIGVFANINQSLNFETVARLAADLGIRIAQPDENAAEPAAERPSRPAVPSANLRTRPPIVTFMGHVDHGKTSLLDAIRKTRVAAGEAGGITQHIGAYQVVLEKGAVTFLDTPGHEAFTEMRARGAKVTDVVVLVVAADDSIMPQTEEAIDHAQAADATIVVAINKIDLPGANVDKVKKDLASRNLLPEDWGGKTITVPVSAKTGQGIDQLLEMLLLESELMELKADPSARAEGIVIEAKLSKGSGPVATVLIQNGTLRVGDAVVCGVHYGRVRAMTTHLGERVKDAPPAMPVEIAGLSGVPRAGETFYVVESEVKAREIIDMKQRRIQEGNVTQGHIHLEDLYTEIQAGKIQSLKLILKSDVQGSVEALRGTLMQINIKDMRLNIIHTGIGNITKSDVMLAAASNAIVIGFHVDLSPDAQEVVKLEQVDVRLYEIIYEVKQAIEKALTGMLVPETKESLLGVAEVRQVFKISKVGSIAGCKVAKGKIVRNALCRIVRGGKKVHDGKVTGLKRFKDDAREVTEGFECGISIGNYKEYAEGDRIEVYELVTKAVSG